MALVLPPKERTSLCASVGEGRGNASEGEDFAVATAGEDMRFASDKVEGGLLYCLFR